MSWTAAVWLVVLLCVVQPLPMPSDDYGTVAPEDPDDSIAGLCDERRAGRRHAPIASPGYPRHYNNYPDSTDCGIVILAEEGQQILLEFRYIYIEYSKSCDYDYVKVYDGMDKNAPMLGSFCGTVPIPDLRDLISSGNAMYILFHSDSSVNDEGYSAVYSIVNTCKKPTIENSYISPTEETVHYQESYSVTCMAGYTTYPSDLMVCQRDGTFDVTVACGIHISCSAGEYREESTNACVECADYRISAEGADRCTHCGPGEEANAEHTACLCRAGWSRYRTGYSRNTCVGCGCYLCGTYEVSAEGAEDCTACGEGKEPNYDHTACVCIQYREESDTCVAVEEKNEYCWDEMYNASSQHSPLTSPNYPSEYPNNLDCSTTIYAPRGQLVQLSFNEFQLEHSSNCDSYDWIEIRDGSNSNSPLLGQFCGATLPATLTSTGNALWIRFRSDSSVSRDGFLAYYITVSDGGDPRADMILDQDPLS